MRNLFKFLITSAFVFFSLFFYSASYAVTTTPSTKSSTTTEGKGVLVASIDIENAKIVFQDGKTFKISFTMKNGEGTQTGVKYGVKLFSDDKNQSLVDEKVYDESLTLTPNSSISREITYTPPANLSGNFVLILNSKNTSNFPFAFSVLGKIKITASIKGVQIMPETCFLELDGDKNAKHYPVTQILEISEDQSIRLTCTVINNDSKPYSLKPLFNTKYSGSYGENAPQSGGDDKEVTFAKGEKKSITVALPKGDIAKSYNLKVSLTDGIYNSNEVSLEYLIKGLSATIQNVSLDKNFYKAGEKAELSIIWFGSGFEDYLSPGVSVTTSILNNKGWECSPQKTEEIVKDMTNPVTKLTVDIKNRCEDPHLKIALTDKNGTVLDQKEFTFKSSMKEDEKSLSMLSTKSAIMIVIGLIIIAALGVYLSKKKKINNI